jgi:hypothetical protein
MRGRYAVARDIDCDAILLICNFLEENHSMAQPNSVRTPALP